MTIKKILEQYREMKITTEELYKKIPKDMKEKTLDNPVEVCSNHVINILKEYKNGNITQRKLLDWVNTIWFSGWFEYCDENCDSIASVMNELEEIDEEGKYLSNQKIDDFIYALKNNIEI